MYKDFVKSKKELPLSYLGAKFGDWVIISLSCWRGRNTSRPRIYVEVRCSHNVTKLINLDNLKRGQANGCDVCYRERNGLPIIESELQRKLLQRVDSVLLRCTNPGTNGYEHYKDVEIYGPWIGDRMKFVRYLESLPNCNLKLTIDRINNNKGYVPGNLRWASSKEQATNRKTTKIVKGLNNESISFAEFHRRYIKEITLNHSLTLYNKGYSLENLVNHKHQGTGPKRKKGL